MYTLDGRGPNSTAMQAEVEAFNLPETLIGSDRCQPPQRSWWDDKGPRDVSLSQNR